MPLQSLQQNDNLLFVYSSVHLLLNSNKIKNFISHYIHADLNGTYFFNYL